MDVAVIFKISYVYERKILLYVWSTLVCTYIHMHLCIMKSIFTNTCNAVIYKKCVLPLERVVLRIPIINLAWKYEMGGNGTISSSHCKCFFYCFFTMKKQCLSPQNTLCWRYWKFFETQLQSVRQLTWQCFATSWYQFDTPSPVTLLTGVLWAFVMSEKKQF